MTDILIFMAICLFCQIAIMRIWLYSELFAWLQEWLIGLRDKHRGFTHYIAYLFTCWQCLGTWVSWAVVFLLAWILPGAPITPDNVCGCICIGLGVSLLAEIIAYYFLANMDARPVNSLELVDWKVEDVSAESVINNELKKEDEDELVYRGESDSGREVSGEESEG